MRRQQQTNETDYVNKNLLYKQKHRIYGKTNIINCSMCILRSLQHAKKPLWQIIELINLHTIRTKQ